MKKLIATVVMCAVVGLYAAPAGAWWESGHRLVGLVAADHLTPTAKRNVKALLGNETLADVSAWADDYRPTATQTGGWHFTDVATASDVYDRDRDCPVQPGVKLGTPNDKWRDCTTDRILFFEARLADPKIDPIDRATALKFMVHFVGDIHQPLHATGVEAGGNGISLTAFGEQSCSQSGRCNLHNIWDGFLLENQKFNELQNHTRLTNLIKSESMTAGSLDPVVWTNESKTISDGILLPKGGNVDEAYAEKNLPVINHQIALAGLRLAAVLNGIFTAPPSVYGPNSGLQNQLGAGSTVTPAKRSVR